MIASSVLDLRWLARYDKAIPLPRLAYEPLDDAQGYFYSPQRDVVALNGREYDLARGLIVVDPVSADIGSTLAHEWRHLWQFHRGDQGRSVSWDVCEQGRSYRDAIVEFFRRTPAELDALLFEVRHAPNDSNLEWYEWIIKRNNRPRVEDKQ